MDGFRPWLRRVVANAAVTHQDELLAACLQRPEDAAPIVFMSAHPRVRDLAFEIGADGVLERPFDMLVLLGVVEAALRR